MFDANTAKKGLLEELLKIASEARANKLKSKYAPPPPAAEAEEPEPEGAEIEIKAEGDIDPEVLKSLLEQLGGDEPKPELEVEAE